MMSTGLLEKCHVVHACRIVKMQIKSTSLEGSVVATSGFPGRTPQLEGSPLTGVAVAFECGFDYAEQWTLSQHIFCVSFATLGSQLCSFH